MSTVNDANDGRSFVIPRCRRLTWDLLWFSRSVPLCGHDRQCSLAELSTVRAASPVRISWPALFLKAYGILAGEVPELRQIWYRWPWAHLYQHPYSVGILTVQREYRNAPWLFWGRLHQPECLPLTEIQQTIDHFRTVPPGTGFRKEIKLAAMPTMIRRLIWGWNLYLSRRARAERIGTFFLSSLSGQGVEIQIPPSVHTGCLTYGPLDDTGLMRVTLAYDHRVMDGARVATCLNRLEQILTEDLCRELMRIAETHSASRGAA
jgi:hypothetical protein